MDEEKLKSLFEDKYERALGVSYQDWLLTAPSTQDEAYNRCNELDKLLNETYDKWFEAKGDEKDKLETQRQNWKMEYDLIEELFHLDFEDRSW